MSTKPIKNHRHGVNDLRCGHPDCRAAHYRYQKQWALDVARGKHRTVSPERVRKHVETLMAAGYSVRAIAEIAKVSPSVVSRLRLGRQKRVTRKVASAIARLTPDSMPDRAAPRGFVAKAGTVRRLQALIALGWPVALLADHAGQRPTWIYNRLHAPGDWVTQEVRDQVAAMYDVLSMTPPPEDTPELHRAVARARTTARKQGWLPPLAWDDDRIDDPAYRPNMPKGRSYGYDHAVVERFMASGERPQGRKLTRSEAAEIVRRLRARGHTTFEIERYYGFNSDRYPEEGRAS